MKIAVIDLGSNTFHLVIVDVNNHTYKDLIGKPLERIEIARKRLYVRIGEGSLALGYITPEAKQRALDAMIKFREMIDAYEVNEIYAVATSAMRNASNTVEIVDSIHQLTNIPVEVISGAQEAALIYKGVKAAVKIEETSLIMDIGGGSVEFIICQPNKPLWAQSFEIGAQRLVDNFHQNDPIQPENLLKLEAYLEESLQPLFQALDVYKPTRLIGSSGAFTTLVSMHRAKEQMPIVDPEITAYELPFEKLIEIYKGIRYKNHEERLQIPGLSDQRVDMIVVSTALIYFILNRSNIRKITASKYSLKVGLFFHALEKLQSSR
ncbi:Ppx/GppA phosphatase [Candidatus Amoebophilus asiaticus 5a2]|uniref:Ppx/GppA phosphatase n=1 Tax=Amoebophilus asiaticus (strain 5a2) TaxID=452471 RepID=B3EU60_AMOA5|nr:Ppx/GppA phosphatase [Candidatus Amoebophilus asiaticus]ACE05479.1 Ppx/GppA phosphatase [Candidatus Amoebophilus asiaticus 5a2]